MENKTYYYLINNEIKKGAEMPDIEKYKHPKIGSDHRWIFDFDQFKYDKDFFTWKTSLQLCDISESELEKVKNYFKNIDFWDESKIVDVTELIRVVNESYTHNGNILGECEKIYLKQPKQVYSDKIEAIEFADWISENYFVSSSGLYHHNNWNGDMDTLVNYTTKELYEIFLKEKNIS